jgi:hypothetical protein
MNKIKIRIIPIIGLFFCFTIFFSWMSHDFYPNNSLGYGFIAALCTTFCLYFTIKGIQDNEDFTDSIPEKLKFNTAPTFTLALITFISFIIIVISLTSLYSNIKENELKQFGKITTAEITNGYSLTNKNSVGTYNVTVEYYKNGTDKIEAYTRVSPTEFNNCYLGKQVRIIYSTKNNALIDILGDDSKVQTYTKIKNREILITDLISLIDLDENQTLASLNAISYPWEYNQYKKAWSNNEKNLVVAKNDNTTISYLTTSYNPMEINDELKKLKFDKIVTNSDSKSNQGSEFRQSMFIQEGMYINEKFRLVLKNTIIGNGVIALIITIDKNQKKQTR